MNPRTRRYILPFLALAALLVAAAVALAARPQVSPDPVTFSGHSFQNITISNPGPGDAHWRISLSAGAPHFKLDPSGLSQCRVVPSGQSCKVRVSYGPSGAAEDDGTLRIDDQQVRPNSRDVQLIGHPGSGGPPAGGGNGPDCTLHVGRHQKLVKRSSRKTVRSPFQVALLSSEDGTVSARASGKTAAGQSISLHSVSSPDSAGNGVVMKMKLGRSTESHFRADLAKGRKPKMTLTGTCSDSNGASAQHAVIHFSDARGKGFKLPLEADARAR
jgi:hypothetical protein